MKKCFIYCFLLFTVTLRSQQIKVSREINVKNDIAYDILPNVDKNTLLYRDKYDEYFFDVFTNDLDYVRTIQLEFERNKVNIVQLLARDTTAAIVYAYKNEGTFYIKAKVYDSMANVLDTINIFETNDDLPPVGLKSTVSEDKSKILLFGRVKKNFVTYVFDFISNTLIWHSSLELSDLDLSEDFRKILVTNSGKVYILFEQNNTSYHKDDHFFQIFHSQVDGKFLSNIITSYGLLNSGLAFEYDNKNGDILLTGLIGEDERVSSGYFLYNKLSPSLEEDTITLMPFDENLSSEIYPNEKDQNLVDFEVKDIVFREDGGCIVFAELIKSYVRRTSFPSRFDGDQYSTRGFIDHYNEDIIVFNFNPDRSLSWRQVLHKKQFSQDDDGAFSSYFIFSSPSRLRVIYNDEIKSSNTVSEYEMDPLGNYERNTVLNTDYQNLKLRFLSAVQTGANELIVPSEKANKINLVKIYY